MTDTIARMPDRKRIALVAHDDRKQDLLEWCKFNRERLSEHILCGTGTTATIIAQALGLEVTALKSGPLGGDQQLGAKIVQSEIDLLIFFWDPLETHPHDPDVRALLRVATMQNIPVAPNRSTADFIFSSPLMIEPYDRHVYDYEMRLKRERIIEQVHLPTE
ncbi:MAG TPA: methylglyoxal synthase [Aggregatilinea sp.]|jgi:methylglyoxal synthase|uniref:methylglyoxal synthase n=1 Tax=Aggregatilinea sp. TaxID=2806333 RepID=UPI002C6813F3|nr:methylglyoxal synthase [Aggregatilinea sp.]HML23631.1 methylglyoxal synthase [Aggregatilinea sp.]